MAAAVIPLVLVLVAGLTLPVTQAAALTPAEALERFLTTEEIQSDWFAPSLLDAVPFAQLAPIRSQMTAGLGAFEEVRPDGDRWLAVYETGMLPAYVTLDDQDRFVGLRLLMPIGRITDLAQAVDALRKMPGKTGLLVTHNGEALAEIEPDLPLAVGSTFKLSVLAALRAEIEVGKRAWADVLELHAAGRSLPSGTIQNWPDGSPVTLHTLALLMISISDNTATDTLIRALGRAAVEAQAPERNRPFLTTGEMFRLKANGEEARRERFLAGDEAERRAILEEIADHALPGEDIFSGDPVAIGIEWFYSARELCALIGRVADLDLMTVNPGVANAAKWSRVVYKGGSEPGVLNMTTWLQAADGNTYCVTLTRNDPDAAIDEAESTRIYTGILEALVTAK
jgi:beta-lactamase class A